jgi:hypothetical protein
LVSWSVRPHYGHSIESVFSRRGRSFYGAILKASAPLGKWGTQTFIAGLRCDELTASRIIEGAMNRAAVDT